MSRIDAAGARRRIRAMNRDGHALLFLASRMGVDQRTLQNLATGVSRQVYERTATLIDAAYVELDGQTGPCTHARLRAYRRGWAGRDQWTADTIDVPGPDPVVPIPHDLGVVYYRPRTELEEPLVDRACGGEHLQLTSAEKNEAIRRLNRVGLNDHQISDRIGLSARRVLSRRVALGLPAGTDRRPRGHGLTFRAAS